MTTVSATEVISTNEAIHILSSAHFDAFYHFCEENIYSGRPVKPLLPEQGELLRKIERSIRYLANERFTR